MSSSLVDLASQYLDSYEWGYVKSDSNQLLVRFASEDQENEFQLVISMSEHWVSFTIWPYIFAIPSTQKETIARRLSKLNFDGVRLVRFAENEEGEIVVCADLPVEGLTEALFHRTLDLISYYAEANYQELVKMAVAND